MMASAISPFLVTRPDATLSVRWLSLLASISSAIARLAQRLNEAPLALIQV